MPSTIARVALLVLSGLAAAWSMGAAQQRRHAEQALDTARDEYVIVPATDDAPAMSKWTAAELAQLAELAASKNAQPAVLSLRTAEEEP